MRCRVLHWHCFNGRWAYTYMDKKQWKQWVDEKNVAKWRIHKAKNGRVYAKRHGKGNPRRKLGRKMARRWIKWCDKVARAAEQNAPKEIAWHFVTTYVIKFVI